MWSRVHAECLQEQLNESGTMAAAQINTVSNGGDRAAGWVGAKQSAGKGNEDNTTANESEN